MANPAGSVRDLRLLILHKRFYGKSVEYTPRLNKQQTQLKPPPPPKLPLPKLDSIKIPERIERGPTDILKALASTVGRDYTAPHYKFHDDPYLIPYSNMSKRAFALSKEAGRKAAKWIRQEHRELFQHQEAEPPIEAFYPLPVFNEESNVEETDLIMYIKQGFLPEAVQVYEIMKSKTKDVSQETKQSFLELLCYFNEEEPTDDDLVEEKWFKMGMVGRDARKNSWKDRGLAETLFKELENPDINAYCAMIRGRAKFYQADQAWHLFKEVQSKGVILDTETYNSILKITNFLRENSEMRWTLIEELLVDMEQNGVLPNLGTLNSILESLCTLGNPRQSKNLALSTLSEFKKLGIEPSLGSYYYILLMFCKERGPVSTILTDILRDIDGREFKIQDPKDTFFFLTAMDVCRNHLQNVELAYKVDALLHTGNNYDLIGDSFKESIYYRHYVALKCVSEPFDMFMEFYNKIVPNIYTPEPGITEEILNSLEINTAIQYLPQLWSDIIIFDQNNRDTILAKVLHIMSTYYPTSSDVEISQPSKLAEQFTDIAWKIWTIIETQDRDRPRQIGWTGKMLGDLISIQIRGDKFDNASEVIKKLISTTSGSEVLGIPNLEPLKRFLDAAIDQNNGPMSLACLQYIGDCGYPEVSELAEETYSKVKLDPIQTVKLSNIVGFDISSSTPRIDRKISSQAGNEETQ